MLGSLHPSFSGNENFENILAYDNSDQYLGPLDCDSSLLQRAYIGAAVYFAGAVADSLQEDANIVFLSPNLGDSIDGLGLITKTALENLGTHAPAPATDLFGNSILPE
jgi:hypothetical protein